MQLDDVVATTSPDLPRIREATHRSVRWLDRCIAAHCRPSTQSLFCIVQGGLDLDLRRWCCAEMAKRDTPGVAIGGLSGGEEKGAFCRVYVPSLPPPLSLCILLFFMCRDAAAHGGCGRVDTCTSLLPIHKPRYVMGVGYPEDLLVSIALGADMFDCVWPTRTAVSPSSPTIPSRLTTDPAQRFGNALTPTGTLNLRAASFAHDFQPLYPACPCNTCRPKSEGGTGATRAFLHHLVGKETAGAHVLTVHNVHYMMELMGQAREAIVRDEYPAFLRAWFRVRFGEAGAPGWVGEALRGVGVDLDA